MEAPNVNPEPEAQPQAAAPQASFAPAAPTAAATQRLRVHNSYIWLGSLRALGLLVVVLVVTSMSSLISLAEWASQKAGGVLDLALGALALGAGALVLFGAIVLVHYLAWRHMWYEVGPEEFTLYSGILNKKRVHVPYRRVQSVDQKASLLQRVFGVCNVTIDTAGGASNKAILVPYLTKQQADTLRAELFARKQGVLTGQPGGAVASGAQGAPSAVPAPLGATAAATATPANVLDAGEAAWGALGHGLFSGDAVDTGAVTYEYGLTNRELVLTGLSNNTAFVVAVLAVVGFLAQALDFVLDVVPGSSEVANGAVAAAGSLMATEAAGALIALGIGAIVVVALVLWALSVAGACLSYGGFHARRRGERIEVERGLLQHQIQGVSIGRVQSVVVKQSLIRRLLGYCELSLGKIDAATGDEAQQKQNGLAEQGLVIHPFVKLSRVPEILAGLVPELADVPSDRCALPKVALRRALVRRCLWQGSGFWLAVGTALLQGTIHLMMGMPGFLDDPSDAAALPIVDLVAGVLYALAVVLLVLDAVGAVLWQRSSGFAVDQRFMTVTNGGLSTETVTFPRQKIQFGYVKDNPLQRRAGTATLNARTAAGVGGTTVRLVDVTAEAAASWLEWLEPKAA